MTKIILIALVIIFLSFGGYIVFSQTQKVSPPQKTSVVTQTVKQVVTPTVVPTIAATTEDDLTALEKDLLVLEKEDTTFTEDLKGI